MPLGDGLFGVNIELFVARLHLGLHPAVSTDRRVRVVSLSITEGDGQVDLW